MKKKKKIYELIELTLQTRLNRNILNSHHESLIIKKKQINGLTHN